MNQANPSSPTAAIVAASAVPATLAGVSRGIADRLRNLSERPQSLRLRELIDAYMQTYAGSDGAMGQRLATWQLILGDFSLEALDDDVIHAARAELIALPALNYKGRDSEGKPIFKTKSRNRVKTPATINRYLAGLSSVLTWAKEQRMTPKGWKNPCRGIKRLPEPDGRVRFLDADERAALFTACKASQYTRLYAMVLMAMLCGARRGELLSLRWNDMDLERGVAQLEHTKNGDRRTLVLLPQVIEALRPFATDAGNRYVFGSMRARHQKPACIDSAWRDAVARAGVKNFRFHDLRHCFGSYMAQAGVDLHVIASALGHRKLDMTRRYSHLKTQTTSAAMQSALGGIGGVGEE